MLLQFVVSPPLDLLSLTVAGVAELLLPVLPPSLLLPVLPPLLLLPVLPLLLLSLKFKAYKVIKLYATSFVSSRERGREGERERVGERKERAKEWEV